MLKVCGSGPPSFLLSCRWFTPSYCDEQSSSKDLLMSEVAVEIALLLNHENMKLCLCPFMNTHTRHSSEEACVKIQVPCSSSDHAYRGY